MFYKKFKLKYHNFNEQKMFPNNYIKLLIIFLLYIKICASYRHNNNNNYNNMIYNTSPYNKYTLINSPKKLHLNTIVATTTQSSPHAYAHAHGHAHAHPHAQSQSHSYSHSSFMNNNNHNNNRLRHLQSNRHPKIAEMWRRLRNLQTDTNTDTDTDSNTSANNNIHRQTFTSSPHNTRQLSSSFMTPKHQNHYQSSSINKVNFVSSDNHRPKIDLFDRKMIVNGVTVSPVIRTTTTAMLRSRETGAAGGASFDEYDDSVDDVSMESDPSEYDDIDLDSDDEDRDDIDKDDDEDMDDDEKEDNWQAEDSNQQVSAFTEEKWQLYGTRERVTKTRDTYFKGGGTYQQLKTEAELHVERMNKEGLCKIPRPRIISVQSVHPDLSRTYIPSCTILHRCAEDTGCCDHGTCAPKKQKRIELYFHIVDTFNRRTIQRLEFDNHTECYCKLPSMETDQTIADMASSDSLILRRDVPRNNYQSLSPEPITACKCPSDYDVEFNGICQCICKSETCHPRNVGKEHFGLEDRICIQRNECKMPNCLHGVYLSKDGMCPKKDDKINLYSGLNHTFLSLRKKRLHRIF